MSEHNFRHVEPVNSCEDCVFYVFDRSTMHSRCRKIEHTSKSPSRYTVCDLFMDKNTFNAKIEEFQQRLEWFREFMNCTICPFKHDCGSSKHDDFCEIFTLLIDTELE